MKHPLKPNHLAAVIDHQKSAASTLPKSLMVKVSQLNQLTYEIKNLLDNCLPDEILNTLQVGKYKEGQLVLSVQSQTAANHLRYQSNNLTQILREQSLTLKQLKNIDVIVTNFKPSNETITTKITKNKPTEHFYLEPNKSESVSSYGLSESTKRTITYTARHVIKDKRLRACLEKMAKP